MKAVLTVLHAGTAEFFLLHDCNYPSHQYHKCVVRALIQTNMQIIRTPPLPRIVCSVWNSNREIKHAGIISVTTVSCVWSYIIVHEECLSTVVSSNQLACTMTIVCSA